MLDIFCKLLRVNYYPLQLLLKLKTTSGVANAPPCKKLNSVPNTRFRIRNLTDGGEGVGV